MVVNSLAKDTKKNYYRVTIDNEEYLLHEEVILKYRLVKDKEITEVILNECLNDNNYEIVYSDALKYISRYPQSKKLLEKHLLDKKYSNEAINYAVNKLISLKLIDDYSYGLSLLNSFVNQGYGYNMIKNKLTLKLIDSNNISLILENINYDDYNEALYKLIAKNKKRYQSKANPKLSLIKFLYNRGYLIDEINNALDNLGE